MPSSSHQTNESECDFSHIKPLEIFEYPNQASKIIWGLESNKILQISSQIIDMIKTNKITIKMAIHLIEICANIRVKEIGLYAEFYQKILNEFSLVIKPKDKKLAALLYYKGFEFENFKPKFTQEEILNIYPPDSPFYYVAWDKVNAIKSRFPNLDVNEKFGQCFTLLDCAIKYGSELCFNYLINIGAKYTFISEDYAVQGGNKTIFMRLIDDGHSFDKMINTAIDYRNFEIAEYLQCNFGQIPDSLAESMYFGNFDVASFLLSNRADINDDYNLFLFISIIDLMHSLSLYINHSFI